MTKDLRANITDSLEYPTEATVGSGSPSRVWMVPYQQAPFFVGHEEILTQLNEHFWRTEPLDKHFSTKRTTNQTQVLSGSLGVGKTRIALEYIHRYGNEYLFVFWARALSRPTLIADLVRIAHFLNLPEKDERDHLVILHAVKCWLATHNMWLLILDNANDPSILSAFLPHYPSGNILVTTCASFAHTTSSILLVEKIAEPDSTLEFLRRIAAPSNVPFKQASEKDQDDARAIVKELDGFPLALNLAGVYISETRCSLADYLARYRMKSKELKDHQSSFASTYHASVTVAFFLSFHQVERTEPAAADLLRLCAFFAPEAIPEEYFTWRASSAGPNLDILMKRGFGSAIVLATLLRFSLISHENTKKKFSMPPLLQEVLRNSLSPQEQRQWAERAIKITS
jgi:hypothetical protein